jgi:ketosteroid isomerase-like protein
MTTPTLPSPVSAYVDATNSFNLDRFLATFADDALVNDHRDEFVGKEQIRTWAAREIIGDHVTMKVVDARLHGDHMALKAEIDGDFDKKGLPSPLVLAFYFSLERDRIGQLVIVHNKPRAEQGAT